MTEFTSPIPPVPTTEDGAIEFVRWAVVEVGPCYHPDTRLFEVFDRHGRTCYDDEACEEHERRHDAAHRILGEEIYAVALREWRAYWEA